MNYSDLSAEDRIKLASDYALLLIEETFTEEDILVQLQQNFLLTSSQAMEAYQRTRIVHRSEFSRLQNLSIFRALISFIVSLCCGLFYVFLGSEVVIIFAILGIVFLIAAYFSFVIAIQKILDKFFPSPTLISKRLSKSRGETNGGDWTVNLFLISHYAFIIAFFLYFKNDGVVNPDNIVTLRNFQFRQPPVLKQEGRRGQYYYSCFFDNCTNEFKFYKSFYKYASSFNGQNLLGANALFDIQIKASDEVDLSHAEGKSRDIKLLNIVLYGKPIIDFAARNKDQLRLNKLFIQLSVAGVILFFVIMILRHKLAHDNDRQLGITSI